MRSALAALLALAALALAGCPQERPGAEREIPRERVPPAVSIDVPPTADAGSPADGGALPAPRRP